VLAARARGLPTRQVLMSHAFRPSLFSLITIAGVTLGRLLGGTVLVEYIYSLPGLGQLAVQSINSRDYIMLRGVLIVVAIAYVLVNTLVDVSYPLLDPRVRAQTK
jgi:peptide/nickel transport system permease protein